MIIVIGQLGFLVRGDRIYVRVLASVNDRRRFSSEQMPRAEEKSAGAPSEPGAAAGAKTAAFRPRP